MHSLQVESKFPVPHGFLSHPSSQGQCCITDSVAAFPQVAEEGRVVKGMGHSFATLQVFLGLSGRHGAISHSY